MGQRHLISLSIYLRHCFLKTLSSCYCSTFATKYRIKKKCSLNYHKSKKHAIWSTDLPNLIGHYSVVWWHPCKCLTFLVFWEQYSYISIVFYSPLLSPLVSLQPLFTYDINDGLLGKTSFSGVCSMEQPACWTWVKLMKVLEIGDQLNVLQEGDKHLTDYHTHLCYCHLRWLFSLFIFFLGVLPLLFVFLWHDFPAGHDHSLMRLLYFHLILCKEQWRVWTVLVSVHVKEDAMGSWDCETRPKGHLGTVKLLLCALKSCSSCISSLVLRPPDC